MNLHERVLEQVVGEGGVAALRQQIAADPSRQRGIQPVERLDAALEIALHQGAQLAFRRVHLLLCFGGHRVTRESERGSRTESWLKSSNTPVFWSSVKS